MSGEVRRYKRELAYEGAMLKVYKDYMEFENGSTDIWDYMNHPGGAAVVPVLEDGRILMVTQYRSAVERETLEIPAGKVDLNETGFACAKRELEEETGYVTSDMRWLVDIETMVAFGNEKIQIFTAHDLVPSRQRLDENEYIHVKAYAPEELKQMIFMGKIKDAKTVAAILAYEINYLKK